MTVNAQFINGIRALKIVLLVLIGTTLCQGSSQRVRLADVQALTLHANRMTTGRRTAPLPQLQCIGGSAGCGGPLPQVMQCVNRGSDGSSVQWECKAETNSKYRLGEIEVVCEGYDYPDDPYILKGSCSVEYRLEKSYNDHNTDSSYGWKDSNSRKDTHHRKSGSSTGIGDLLFFVGCMIIIYGIYKTCIAGNAAREYSEHGGNTGDGPDDGMGPGARRNPGWNVPGYGTNMGYGGDDYYSGDSCGPRGRPGYYGGGTRGGGGGFFSGLATGGLLGYMFGNNSSRRNRYNSGGGGFFSGGGSRSDYGGGSSSAGTSTSTSTGFGGSRGR